MPYAPKAVTLTLALTSCVTVSGITKSGNVFVMMNRDDAVMRVTSPIIRRKLGLRDVKQVGVKQSLEAERS